MSQKNGDRARYQPRDRWTQIKIKESVQVLATNHDTDTVRDFINGLVFSAGPLAKQHKKSIRTMQIVPAAELISKKCVPCEGGVDACTLEHSQKQLSFLPNWLLSDNGKWIHRKLVFKNFLQAVSCINKIAELSEAEAHHPDLHLTSYRNLEIAVSTHAIDGLSENDFILASKIDALVATEFPKLLVSNSGMKV